MASEEGALASEGGALASEGRAGNEELERRLVITPALLLCFRFSEHIYGLAIRSCECGGESQICSFVIFFPDVEFIIV